MKKNSKYIKNKLAVLLISFTILFTVYPALGDTTLSFTSDKWTANGVNSDTEGNAGFWTVWSGDNYWTSITGGYDHERVYEGTGLKFYVESDANCPFWWICDYSRAEIQLWKWADSEFLLIDSSWKNVGVGFVSISKTITWSNADTWGYLKDNGDGTYAMKARLIGVQASSTNAINAYITFTAWD